MVEKLNYPANKTKQDLTVSIKVTKPQSAIKVCYKVLRTAKEQPLEAIPV